MRWFTHDSALAVKRGLATGGHILERGVALAGTAKAAYDLANQFGTAMRAVAPMAAAIL